MHSSSLPPGARRGVERAPWVRWLLAATCLGSLAASCAGDSFSSLGGEGGAAEGGDTGQSGEAGRPEGGGVQTSGGRASGGTGGTTNTSGGTSGQGQGGDDEGGSPPEFGGGPTGTGGTPATGGAATTGGTLGSGGAPTTGGTPATGGAPTGGTVGTVGGGNPGGGSPGEACHQPIVPGPCDGTIPRFAFRADFGICEPFIYGGCEGNQNNFETIEDCYAACGGKGEIDPTSCEDSGDCAILERGCCSPCEPVSVDQFVGVANGEGTSQLLELRDCLQVACAPCPGPEGRPERPWIGVKCDEGHCIAFDARQTELTECEENEDCRLRYGVGCCEGCEGVPDSVVAVSTDADFGEPYCSGDIACATCTPPPPVELMAICGQDQHCAVVPAVTPVID